jgi:hypothetical protein
MTLNSNALTTWEHVASVLRTYPFIASGIDFNDADVQDEIMRLINYWSSFVEQATNTTFAIREYVETYRGSTHPTLTLKHYPIKEVSKLEQISSTGEVVYEYDVEALMSMTNEQDLLNGMLYFEPSWGMRSTTIGIIPEAFVRLRSIRVTYTAGYVLPKDATEDVPSTLPSSLEELVAELVKAQFIQNTDAIRANNLIGLTEGNVQRLWAQPAEFKLTAPQEKVLSYFKRRGI